MASHFCRSFALIAAVFASAGSNFAAAQEKAKPPQPPPGVIYEADIEYGKGGETPLYLDLARPEKLDKHAPAIVVIHGGGWRGGNRKLHTDMIFNFAKLGYVAATVQYRLVPAARFPAQIEDAKCSVRYLRANSDKYKLDPQRIGAIGFSAGAHLSMLLGTMDPQDGLEGQGGNPAASSKVQAVVAYFGPTDLSAVDYPPIVIGMINDLVNATAEEDPVPRKRASPLTYVNPGDAPLLIFQGTKDPLVPHSQAILMAEAMTKAGVPGHVDLLIGASHGWGGVELLRTATESIRFFGEHLKHSPSDGR